MWLLSFSLTFYLNPCSLLPIVLWSDIPFPIISPKKRERENAVFGCSPKRFGVGIGINNGDIISMALDSLLNVPFKARTVTLIFCHLIFMCR